MDSVLYFSAEMGYNPNVMEAVCVQTPRSMYPRSRRCGGEGRNHKKSYCAGKARTVQMEE